MATITIIVPCFNAEGYVRSFGEMLCKQTFNDWIAFLVDDCSSDLTGALINELASADQRFQLLSRSSNSGGPFLPRFLGLSRASTDYVCLLDVDDIIDPQYLERLLSRMGETSSDIVFPDMRIEDRSVTSVPFDRVYRGDELVGLTLFEWGVGCNGGLYKTSLLKEIYLDLIPKICGEYFSDDSQLLSLPELKLIRTAPFSGREEDIYYPRYIDEVATRLLLLYASKVAFAKEAIYSYIPGDQSVSNPSEFRSLGFLINDMLLAEMVPVYFRRQDLVGSISRQQFYGVINKMKLLGRLKPTLDLALYRRGDELIRVMFERMDRRRIRPHVGKPLFFLTSLGYRMTKSLLWLHGRNGWRKAKGVKYFQESLNKVSRAGVK